MPDHLKPMGAERIFKLGPDGLQFTQPVTAAVKLAGGNQLPVMVIESGGEFEPAAKQQVVLGADERRVSGQLTHFSYLTVTKTVEPFTLILAVDKRELKEGEDVTASYKLSASAQGGTVRCAIDPEALGLVLARVSELEDCIDHDFTLSPGGEPFISATTWRCVEPGTEEIRVFFGIKGFATLVVGLREGQDYDVEIEAAIDVVCKAKDVVITIGVTKLPFDMTKPDGLVILNGPWAGIEGSGPFAAIAGKEGLVIMDLPKSLSALNMTSSGPDGKLGDNLLGVLPISLPNPGPDTPAGLFGTSLNSSFVRNYIDGAWGFVQISPLTGYIDASNGGGRIDAVEMVTVAPRDGVNFVRYHEETKSFNFAPDLSIFRSQFSGDLRSAVLPSDAPGPPVLVLTANTDDKTTSTVWAHLRDPNQRAVKLTSFSDADARQIRCLPVDGAPAALNGRIPCMVTGFATGTARYLIYDPANPTATPEVQTLEVGAGPVGVQFGLRAGGNPWAVVSNFTAGSFTVISFDGQGTVSGKKTVTLPDGCPVSAHAAPFSYAGGDYVVGTCFDAKSYFVLADEP